MATTTLFFFWGRGVRHMLTREPSAPTSGESGGVSMSMVRFAFGLLPGATTFLRDPSDSMR